MFQRKDYLVVIYHSKTNVELYSYIVSGLNDYDVRDQGIRFFEKELQYKPTLRKQVGTDWKVDSVCI